MIINLNAVIRLNGKYVNACFPRTVELPQQNAANNANNAAIIALLSQPDIGLVPNVTK